MASFGAIGEPKVVRRFIAFGALTGACGSFALAILLWRRFVLRECGSLDAESAANCFQTQMPNILVVCFLFVPCVLFLAIHLARTERRINVRNTVNEVQADSGANC